MCASNPTWGAPRIHGELLKLGIDVSQTTVSKYIVRRRNPPCQTWRAFLDNHIKQLVSIDFFVVPTIDFKLMFQDFPRRTINDSLFDPLGQA